MVQTCREVLFSENGELKKALIVSKTTFMMYFSRIGSDRRFSRLLQTCTNNRRNALKDFCLSGWLHCVDTYPSHIHCKVFKELPDVIGCVYLFHLHLCVHIAMIHKVYIGHLHLKQTATPMKKQVYNITETIRAKGSTSVMQSSCVTTRTTSSSGRREVHLISV